MKTQIDRYKLIRLSLGFICFTIIGILSHEYGHIFVAQKLGYTTKLHYGSMSWYESDRERTLEIYREYKTEIKSQLDFPKQEEWESLKSKNLADRLKITLGGVLQTIVTGTLGLLFLIFRYHKIKEYGLKVIDWLGVFLSLFWLREIFNLLLGIGGEIVNPDGSFFGGDEAKISSILNLPAGTLSIILGTIGLIVSLFVVFKIVDKELQTTFILSGLLGGISGFVLWMMVLGPRILP
ncbi:MAG: hypothetical protein ACPG49_04520 [Chitinophagales bacterium]